MSNAMISAILANIDLANMRADERNDVRPWIVTRIQRDAPSHKTKPVDLIEVTSSHDNKKYRVTVEEVK